MIAVYGEALKNVGSKTRSAYNAAADRYHELFHDELKDKAYDRALLDRLKELLEPGALVLDAGCGPCGHVGRYLADRGLEVCAVDISDRCVELAREHNPGIACDRADIAHLPFPDRVFDATVSFYSVIDTPKSDVQSLFDEMARVTKRDGLLLVAVKAGSTEGFVKELLGVESEIYFTLFSENDIRTYLSAAECTVEFLERRNPYDFEIDNERIFAIARKQ